MNNELSGKIGHEIFDDLILENCGSKREEVSTGPSFGVDTSIVDLPNGLALVSTSDPLSLIPSLGLEESAWLSVHLLANDMATTSFAPMYAQFVLNLPDTLSRQDFRTYWEYIHKFCKDIGVAITGGHTGFIEGQNSTISGGGTFSVVAPKAEILISKNAKPSNVILVTKKCAISSSSLLAMSFPSTTINKAGKETYEEACRMFYQTTSLEDGLTAAGTESKHPEVTAMHDVTEGGVLGAIYELVTASGNGAIVYNDKLPVEGPQQEICDIFSIDPRYSIGAGSMIITCEKGKEQDVIRRLARKDIKCTAVGEIKSREQGIKIVEADQEKDLIYLQEDPYWKAFFNAYKSGWK